MDPTATFLKRFGDLVALLRGEPGNDAAQDLALTAASAAILHGPVRIEVGIVTSGARDPFSLQARMLARRVDTILITSDIDVSELLSLARALAHDTSPLPQGRHLEVTYFPGPAAAGTKRPTGLSSRIESSQSPAPPVDRPTPPPPERANTERRRGPDRRRYLGPPRWLGPDRRHGGSDRRASGERRQRMAKDVRAEGVRLYGGLVQASDRGAWEETLYTTLGLARLAPRVPESERRSFLIQVRRAVRRSAVEAIIDGAERDPAVQHAAVEVLRWLGLDAADIMLERLRGSSVLGPRAFLIEALGRMPEAYPLVLPLLRSDAPHEIRCGGAIASWMGRSEAAEPLTSKLEHPDDAVRAAAVEALGQLHLASVGDSLRTALRHPSPSTRIAATEAIATWRGGVLGMALSAALRTEEESEVWFAIVAALGRIGSSAACAALATLARSRRSLLWWQGYGREQRLAAVTALARATTPSAAEALAELARDGDDEVRAHARSALEHRERVEVVS